MGNVEKKYAKGDLTVVWKPEQCIHSTLCWKGLTNVFNPKNRPWVNVDGGDAEEIMEQVSKCPSGALSYVLTERESAADDAQVELTTSVEVMKNGPLLVYGSLTVKNDKGGVETKSKVTAFCRCGASANKPYCDGSHIKIDFKGE